MSLIIPYEEEQLYNKEDAFINPAGEIIFTFGEHEKFARDFCAGEQYSFLSEVKCGWSYYSSHFEEFKKVYNFEGKIEDIDVYKSTNLTSEQLELYKLWLEEYEFSKRNLYSDFMVYMLGFDKIETVMRRAITTSNPQAHIRFYNYYLMDWKINCLPPMKFDKDNGYFEYDETGDWDVFSLKRKEDREAESEIDEIKSKVLLRDRPAFFK